MERRSSTATTVLHLTSSSVLYFFCSSCVRYLLQLFLCLPHFLFSSGFHVRVWRVSVGCAQFKPNSFSLSGCLLLWVCFFPTDLHFWLCLASVNVGLLCWWKIMLFSLLIGIEYQEFGVSFDWHWQLTRITKCLVTADHILIPMGYYYNLCVLRYQDTKI